MRRSDRRDAGFTLIEILIAMVILIVGLIGILAVFPQGMRSNVKMKQNTQAAVLARSLQQALRAGMRDVDTSDQFWVVHDGLEDSTNGTTGRAQFTLPGSGSSVHYDNGGKTYFLGNAEIGGEGSAEAITEVAGEELRELYDQYSYGIDIWPRVEDGEELDGLYEFLVTVYRNHDPANNPSDWTSKKHPDRVHQFRFVLGTE